MSEPTPSTVVELAPGTSIANRYRVLRRVGSGAVGEVWAGEHIGLCLPVAIKTLSQVHAKSHEMVARFRREAMLLARVRSDSVARALDYVEDPKHGQLLVMELLAGEPLSEAIEKQRMSVEDAIALGLDLTEALGHLHSAHLVHRDLKPGNVILERANGGRRRGVLVDFGASRMLSGYSGDDGDDTLTAITRADMAIGTMEYMAPEQMLSARDVTAACDCYALGAILYRVVAGHHVYGELGDGKLVRAKLLKDAPPLDTGRTDAAARGLEALVARALRRQTADRYASAIEMAVDLETLRDLVKVRRLERFQSVPDDPDTTDETQAPFELIPFTPEPEPPSQDAVDTQPPPPPTTVSVAPPRASKRARAAVLVAICATVAAFALPTTLVVGDEIASTNARAVPAWLETALPDAITFEMPAAPVEEPAAAPPPEAPPPKPRKVAARPKPPAPPTPTASEAAPGPSEVARTITPVLDDSTPP